MSVTGSVRLFFYMLPVGMLIRVSRLKVTLWRAFAALALLVVSCVAPERAQPFQRLLEHVLELPREHRFFNSAVMWMDDLLARCGKHDPAGFRRARVLFGLMLLRRGHPAGDVLRHWQRSSPQSVRPTVPKRYQQIFARTYGAPPDLESIAPQAPAEQKAPAEKR